MIGSDFNPIAMAMNLIRSLEGGGGQSQGMHHHHHHRGMDGSNFSQECGEEGGNPWDSGGNSPFGNFGGQPGGCNPFSPFGGGGNGCGSGNGCFAGAFNGCGDKPFGEGPGCARRCGCEGGGQQPGSLVGSTVWGDPHIKDQSGKQTDFAKANGLFINPNGSSTLVHAGGANQVAQSVQAYRPGQAWSIDQDPNQTEVYQDVNGQMKDMGTAQSMGIGYNANNQGVNVDSNGVNLGAGTKVTFDGKGNVAWTAS